MNEIDSSVGFWIKDVPYVFENKKDMETSGRKYLVDYPELAKLSSEPNKCSWAINYFDTNTSGWLKAIAAMVWSSTPTALCNGRTYYYTRDDGKRDKPEFIVTIPNYEYFDSELSTKMSKYNGIWYDLSSLICAQLANSSTNANSSSTSNSIGWPDLLDLMEKCPPLSDCDPCTKVGAKIAKSLIKIAALRIFADPEQSIMELPVNSLDAYSAKEGSNKKIGKFGMGFFSIFYWLIGHPKRYLEIHSFTKNSDGKYVTFSVKIQERNDTLAFRLVAYPNSRIISTGFRVILNAKEDPFTIDQCSNFDKQISKLDYITGATIYKLASIIAFDNITDFRKAKIINPGTNKNIYCVINPSVLLIEDFATGIPYEVFFGSVFVPSISTKTLQLAQTQGELIKFENKSRFVEGTGFRGLVFLIGGIAVVSIAEQKCKPDTYIIDLPSTTRLPVSRDDFILGAEEERILKESIAIVFREVAAKIKDVSCFQTLLEKYIDFTPSAENKRIVRTAMNDFFAKERGLLVPVEHIKLYTAINPNFIVSKTYDVTSIEDFLDRNTKPRLDIWYGVKVLTIMLKGIIGNTTDGGLISYLFIDQAYINKLGSGWINTITSSIFNCKLYPISSSYGKQEYSKYAHFLGASSNVQSKAASVIKNETTRNYYFAVLNKLESLEDRFIIDSIVLKQIASNLLDIFSSIPKKSFTDILTELMAKFSSFKGNQTYGGSKYLLHIGLIISPIPPIVFNFKVPGVDKEKITSFTVSQIIYAIRAIKETNDTQIVTITGNCPFLIFQRYDKTFCEELMLQSLNFAEFQLVMGGAGRAFFTASEKYQLVAGLPKEIIKQIVTHFLEKVRYYQRGPRDVIEAYEFWDNRQPDLAKTTFIYMIKDRKEAEEWINTAQGISNIPKGRELGFQTGIKFKLSSMIRKLFVNDVPISDGDEKRFYSDLAEIKDDAKTKTNLQLIEIAVNEGTVKPFIEAIMTELVQNSIDAAREFKPKNEAIDIKLSAAGDKVILSIMDRVGMTRDAFIYIGIPFLSTKTPSELVTGEMGSGFFNSYRYPVEKLEIDTIRDGTQRVSSDVPTLDETNRVVDIIKSVSINSGTKFDNQTKISIQIPVPTEASFANIVSRVVYTATNVIGLAMAENIKFNGKDIYIKRELSAQINYFELYTTDASGAGGGIKHESYLLTKGIPFAPLTGYFKGILTDRAISYIDRNVILNITHGGYTPVQTRTRINLAPEVENNFKILAIYAVFTTMVRAMSNGEYLYALDHMLSAADPRQLKFTVYEINDDSLSYADETGYLKYTRFYGQPSIVELVNMCIDELGKNVVKLGLRMEFLATKYNSPYPLINERVIGIVNRWFLPKTFSATPGKAPPTVKPKTGPIISSRKKPSGGYSSRSRRASGEYAKLTIPGLKELLRERKLKVGGTKSELVSRLEKDDAEKDLSGDTGDDDSSEVDKDIPDPEMTKIVNIWVSTYWKIASELKIKGFTTSAPKCKAVNSEQSQGKLGYFTPGIRTVTINTFTWSVNDRKQILDVLKRKNIEDFTSGTFKNNKAWQIFFSYSIPSSVLPHELEHARRGNSHSEGKGPGGHDSIYIPLFPGDTSQNRTFNDCANLVFQKVLAAGFYEKFLKALVM